MQIKGNVSKILRQFPQKFCRNTQLLKKMYRYKKEKKGRGKKEEGDLSYSAGFELSSHLT